MKSEPSSGQMPFQSGPVLSVEQQRDILQRRIHLAANWWYWIAGFSAVNTVSVLMHQSWSFYFASELVNAVNENIYSDPRYFAFVGTVVNAVIVGLIALWGFLCGKGYRWAFWTGIILFLLDGVLALFGKNWINAALHGYAIYRIYQGLVAINLLKVLNAAVAAQAPYYARQPGDDSGSQSAANMAPSGQPDSQWYPGMIPPGQQADQRDLPPTELGPPAQ